MAKPQPELPGTSEKPTSIEERFLAFHSANPDVYRHLVRLARQLRDRGREKYSIASLFEVLRWEFALDTRTPERFAINNVFRSRYARLIMERERDLAGFFDVRELKTV